MSEYKVNLTKLFTEYDPYDVSNSIANLGPSAARITWNNAKACAESGELDCLDLDNVRDHIAEYGAWDADEIEAMSDLDLRAFVAQEIAADIMLVQGGEPDLDELAEAYKTANDIDAQDDYPEYPSRLQHVEQDGDDVIGYVSLGI